MIPAAVWYLVAVFDGQMHIMGAYPSAGACDAARHQTKPPEPKDPRAVVIWSCTTAIPQIDKRGNVTISGDSQ